MPIHTLVLLKFSFILVCSLVCLRWNAHQWHLRAHQ